MTHVLKLGFSPDAAHQSLPLGVVAFWGGRQGFETPSNERYAGEHQLISRLLNRLLPQAIKRILECHAAIGSSRFLSPVFVANRSR